MSMSSRTPASQSYDLIEVRRQQLPAIFGPLMLFNWWCHSILACAEQAEEDDQIDEYTASLAPGQVISEDDGPSWFFVVSPKLPHSLPGPMKRRCGSSCCRVDCVDVEESSIAGSSFWSCPVSTGISVWTRKFPSSHREVHLQLGDGTNNWGFIFPCC